MKTNRVEYSIEHIVALKGARVLADVTDFHVVLLAFTIGQAQSEWDALPLELIMESAAARIRHEIRLAHNRPQDAIIPADEGDHAS